MSQEEFTTSTTVRSDQDLVVEDFLAQTPSAESSASFGGDQLSYRVASLSSSSGTLLSMDHGVQGYDYEFVPPVDPKYICPICMLVLRSPVQTECGHRFCANCIKCWLTQNTGESGCPNCKDKITSSQIFPDNFAKREIMNLSLRCPNLKNGCDATLDLHHVQSHLDTLCQFALSPCPNGCSNILLKKDLQHHATVACPKLWMTCSMCQEKINASSYQAHLLTCRMSMKTCPDCGLKIFKSKLKNHQELECPQAIVGCFFLPFGCQYKGKREVLSKHFETCVSEHLQLMAKHVTVLQQQYSVLPPTSPSIRVSEVQQPGHFYPNRYQKYDSGQPQTSGAKLESQGSGYDLCEFITNVTDAGFESATSSSPLDTLPSRHRNQRLAPFMVPPVEGSYESPEVLSVESTASSFESRLSVEDSRIAPTILELRQSIVVLQQVFAQQAERISKLESLPDDIVARHCNGCFLWRIDNVDRHRQAAKNGTATALHSQGFYTSLYGYKICIRINLNGIEKGCSKHVALFIHFMKGDYDDLLDWPFQGTITLRILDQNKSIDGVRQDYTESLEANPNLAAFAKPTTSRNHKGFGYIEFAPLTLLDDPRYMKNGILFVQATVRVSDVLPS